MIEQSEQSPLLLLGSATSPFVRKCRIVATELGVVVKFERVSQWASDSPVSTINPLSKVPILRTPDLGDLYDSRVIVADLERRAGRTLRPSDPIASIKDMRREALGDGIGDAVALMVQETWRPPERRSDVWAERQRDKISRGLATAATEIEESEEGLTTGLIAIASAIGFLDFWMPEFGWQAENAALAAWYDDFRTRSSFAGTAPEIPAGTLFPIL